MVLFATEEQNHCTLGVLREVLKHSFIIEIWKTDDKGGRQLFRRLSGTEIEEPLSLDVDREGEPPFSIGPVRFSKGPDFNRDDLNTEPDDFRWALDLEANLYEEPVNVTASGFRCKMRINSGATYFASRLSVDQIAKAERLSGGGLGDSHRIGRVATAIGGHIFVTQQATEAIFRCGVVADPLPFQRGVNYEIRVCHGSGLDPLSRDNDAENYERVVPSSMSGRMLRLLLHPTDVEVEVGAGDPHAVCLTSRLGLEHEPPQ
jgi:hypothetical protein